jgi:hypothetical protein
MKKGAA